MTLVSNWKEILHKAWSVRLIALVVLFSGLEVAMPFLEGVIDVPPGVFAAIAGLVSSMAILARILAQNNIEGSGGLE